MSSVNESADDLLDGSDPDLSWADYRKTLDDPSPRMHACYQRCALSLMIDGGNQMIAVAHPYIRTDDFQGVHKAICLALLRMADGGREISLESFEAEFRAADDQSDISRFLAMGRRSVESSKKTASPADVTYETLLDFLDNIKSSPTALYFWYDADDILIYVGITKDMAQRQTNHAKRSAWSAFADHSTVSRFLTRESAESAEVDAIRDLRPVFNRAHNETPEAQARLREYLIKHGRIDLLASARSRGSQPAGKRGKVAKNKRANTAVGHLGTMQWPGRYVQKLSEDGELDHWLAEQGLKRSGF
jgi:predicted GIY-YIG superfamily endonuclease